MILTIRATTALAGRIRLQESSSDLAHWSRVLKQLDTQKLRKCSLTNKVKLIFDHCCIPCQQIIITFLTRHYKMMNWGRPMEKIPLIMGVWTFSKITHSSRTSIFIVRVSLSLQKYNSAIYRNTHRERKMCEDISHLSSSATWLYNVYVTGQNKLNLP